MMAAHIAWRLVRRAAVNLWRAPLPSLVSVLTIALALFLGASFAVGVLSARRLLQGWGAEPSVTLYLDRSTSDDEAKALAGRIAETERTESVRYVDRAQALHRLRTELGDLGSALDGLPENPLPPSVEVIPAGSPGPNEVRALASRLGQLSHVVEVDYGREWLDRIEVLGRSMRNFGSGALALVLTADLPVVANTIRLAVGLVAAAKPTPPAHRPLDDVQNQHEEEREIAAPIAGREATLLGRLAELERQIDLEGRANRVAQARHRAATGQLVAAEERARAAQTDVNRRLDALSPRLVARYKLGREGYLRFLLGAQSIADLLKRRRLFDSRRAPDFENRAPFLLAEQGAKESRDQRWQAQQEVSRAA